MTRLIHLAGYEPEQRGSFVPFVLAALTAARDRGWEVEAVFPEGADHRFWLADFENVGIAVTFASGSRQQLNRWLDDRVGDGVPTVLHTHFTAYDVPAALVARRRSDVHVYWHLHSILSNSPVRVVANAAKFRLMAPYVHRVLSPAANVADSVRRRGGGKRRAWVFPNTIDPDAFPLISEEGKAEARHMLGVPHQGEILVHFGRDWRVKGGQVFLDALATLKEDGRPVFGLFNQAGVEARRYLQKLRLEDRVKTVELTADPRVLYGAADVMLAPSRGETMPFTVMESLCSGTPVVASDLPGHRYLGDALDACTIVPRTPGPFAAAACSFLEMAAKERARLCGVARAWIADRLDIRVAAERLVDDYERCLEGGAGSERPAWDYA